MEHDEVDELVEAWTRERADLDLAPVEVFSRISRLARLLDKARREAFTAHRIETWEFDVLAALRRAGRPYQLTPGALLKETMVTSGTMTNRVDRLAERGLVDGRCGCDRIAHGYIPTVDRPVVSGHPCMRLTHWMAPPAVPLTRLSMAPMASTVLVRSS